MPIPPPSPRGRRFARGAALLLTMAAAFAVASPAAAHPRPPASWHKCSGTVIYGGDSWQVVKGVVFANKNTATSYKVKIRPAYPFGWSGYVVANRQSHSSIWVPVGTHHWFPSPAIITGFRTGTYGVTVNVRPNPGVSNYYAVEIWAYYPCRYWN